LCKKTVKVIYKDRELREGTEEGGKGRYREKGQREWEENGSKNLAGASKGTPDNAKCVIEILEGDKNKEGHKV